MHPELARRSRGADFDGGRGPLDAIALLVESMLLLRTDNRPAFVSGREGGIRTRDLSVPNRVLTRRFPNVFVPLWTRVATG